MENKKKIFCFVVLFALMFGGMGFASFTAPTDAAIEPIRPGGNFLVAADPAVDAVSNTANNISGLTADDLFATLTQYTFVANVSDADGYVDIDNVTITFCKAAVDYFSVLYVVSTGVFTEASGATYFRIGSATNISAGAGTAIDLTIPFHIEWAMLEIDDIDVNVSVSNATVLNSASVLANINVDMQTQLTCSDADLFVYPEYLTGSPFGGMELTYHYTGFTTTYPLAAETDFWVSRAAVTSEGVGARAWDSTGYDDSTGVAQFDDIIAPDVNEETTFTFTLYAVNQAGGSADTSLMAVSTTDTVVVGPNAPYYPPDDDSPFISPDIFGTPEGVMLIGGVVVVFGAGTYYFYGRNKTTPTRRRSKRRTPAKKKTKRKRRSSK